MKDLTELIEASTNLVHAQGRMLEKWSEVDDSVKNQLWKNLHEAGDKCRIVLENIKANAV